ncbi:DUF4406 domain-containing protein [Acidihalobacter prosperus]|uniref:DUF4406 domain-containing protein n=1 Tax=Acidihalobacter prosperus TaxID=160660 RepID=A0A1A6C8B2_9GAMM|nr:DUF4406 domain-containing protein [Acidihalobacter prosperus]OBS10807.1 hypothetical protein Thpro_020523 [Acidihalobacter prosperus]
MKIYIAGPMTGLPDNNYPAFHRMADELRAHGYHVENPAENASNPPPCGTWTGWMRLAIAQLIRCDHILMLNGWQNSRGALIEHRLACDLGLTVLTETNIDRDMEVT